MTLSITEQLKQLRLMGILETFEARLCQARENALGHQEWLSLILQDEIERRNVSALSKRLKKAKFEQVKTFEDYDMKLYGTSIQSLIRDLMGGHYLKNPYHVIIEGPTGSGKTHLAQALGHQACRQGKTVRFIRSSVLFRDMYGSRADHTWEKTLKGFTTPDLLIIDDFGLMPLTVTQAEDIYELVAERHLKGSFIFTSNRKIESWVSLFPDPAMGNAVVDRLCHNYGLILESESYRRTFRPSESTEPLT